MKNTLFLSLLFPMIGLAQLNDKDLQFLANHKADKNIEYIKDKGYTFRTSRNLDDGSKMVYYEKSKLNNTLIVLRIGAKLNNIISYVPENKTNYLQILHSIKKLGFTMTDSSSSDKDTCNEYKSETYFAKFCEVKFSNDNDTSYNITFYRRDIDLDN